MIKITRGLALPISGEPDQQIVDAPEVSEVALLGEDYLELKAKMIIRIGHKVKCGDPIWSDKKNEGVLFTAPASGTITHINRGAKRKLLSVVIQVEGDEYKEFKSYPEAEFDRLQREDVIKNLLESGLWPAFRTRPYSKIPAVDSQPSAIFVSMMDTNPLAADPQVIIAEKKTAFNHGLSIIKHLTDGELFVAHDAARDLAIEKTPVANYQSFRGVHPAGNVGTHIHFLKPVNSKRCVWHIGYQDVIAVGELFVSGRLNCQRVVSLAGPVVNHPRLVRLIQGSRLRPVVGEDIDTNDRRVISGSVFNGHIATGHRGYLGRYHNQISVLKEGREKELFGWLHLGREKFSVTRAFISHLMGKKRFDMTTSTHGSERAIMPIGSFERLMPWDILPTQLLRALVVGDTETAQQLGCLEFDEEDLALCTFACPGKYEYGPILRDALTRIEKEG